MIVDYTLKTYKKISHLLCMPWTILILMSLTWECYLREGAVQYLSWNLESFPKLWSDYSYYHWTTFDLSSSLIPPSALDNRHGSLFNEMKIKQQKFLKILIILLEQLLIFFLLDAFGI